MLLDFQVKFFGTSLRISFPITIKYFMLPLFEQNKTLFKKMTVKKQKPIQYSKLLPKYQCHNYYTNNNKINFYIPFYR